MQWYLPCFTFAFTAAVWLETKFDPVFRWSWFVAALFAVCGGIAWLVRHRPRRKIMYSILLGVCVGLYYTGSFVGMVHTPLASLDGKRIEHMQATVTGYAEQYEDVQRVSIQIHTRKSGIFFWMPWFHTTAYVPLTEEPLTPGDTICAKAQFYRGTSNGGFDREAYYNGRNMHILVSCENPQKFQVTHPAKTPWRMKPLLWGKTMQNRLEQRLEPQDSAFLQALLFGNRKNVPTTIQQNFQKAGLSHIMAVSGMHVGFLVMLFQLLLGKRFGMICSLFALVIFVPMAGATPSVMRAAIMYAFVAGGFFLRRDYSALHALCAALLLLLFYNPYAIGSLSLQLSFLASLGLVLCGKRMQNRLYAPIQNKQLPRFAKRLAYVLISAVVCSVCASVFTMPIVLYAFSYASAATVFSNLMTVGVCGVLFVGGLLECLLGGMPILVNALTFGLHIMCRYLFWVAHSMGNIRSFLLNGTFLYVKIGVFLLYLLAVLAWVLRKRISLFRMAAAVCAVFVALVGYNADVLSRQYAVKMFSAGYGQCIAASYGQDCLTVIDCAAGTRQNMAENVENYMDWNGFSTIETLFVTAVTQTHARNIPDLLERVPVRQLVLPKGYKESELSQEILDLAQKQEVPVTFWSATGENLAGDLHAGISILGGVPGKLGVRMQAGKLNILTLHCMTPHMLNTLLAQGEIPCKAVVLSENMRKESNSELLETLHPETIYMPTAYRDSGKLDNIPLQTTKENGDFLFLEILPRGGAKFGE